MWEALRPPPVAHGGQLLTKDYQYTDELSRPFFAGGNRCAESRRRPGRDRRDRTDAQFRRDNCTVAGTPSRGGRIDAQNPRKVPMAKATLTISSKNYSSWSL